MKRMMITILAISTAAVSVGATEIRVDLAPDGTDITFELKATMHSVHGTARLERAHFAFDTATGDASGEAVVMSANSGTGNRKRDKKMHSKVLLSSDHPRIALRAERFEGILNLDGASEITLVGIMELIDVEHAIRIPMTVTITGETATIDATFSVPYVEWGLKDPSTFVLRVGKEVPVTVHVRGAFLSVNASP